MAHYLITKSEDDYDLVLTHVEAKNIQRAIEDLGLENGESVKVYRIASGPKTVSVVEEVRRKVRVE